MRRVLKGEHWEWISPPDQSPQRNVPYSVAGTPIEPILTSGLSKEVLVEAYHLLVSHEQMTAGGGLWKNSTEE
jgi:hypothetical protein